MQTGEMSLAQPKKHLGLHFESTIFGLKNLFLPSKKQLCYCASRCIAQNVKAQEYHDQKNTKIHRLHLSALVRCTPTRYDL